MIVRLPFIRLPNFVDCVRVLRYNDTIYITLSESESISCGTFIVKGNTVAVYNPSFCGFKRYYYFDETSLMKNADIEYSESRIFDFRKPPILSSMVVKKGTEKRIIWIKPVEDVLVYSPHELRYYWDKIEVRMDGNLRALIEDSMMERGQKPDENFSLKEFTSAWIYNKGGRPYLKLFKDFDDMMTIPLVNNFTVSPTKPVIIKVKQ